MVEDVTGTFKVEDKYVLLVGVAPFPTTVHELPPSRLYESLNGPLVPVENLAVSKETDKSLYNDASNVNVSRFAANGATPVVANPAYVKVKDTFTCDHPLGITCVCKDSVINVALGPA